MPDSTTAAFRPGIGETAATSYQTSESHYTASRRFLRRLPQRLRGKAGDLAFKAVRSGLRHREALAELRRCFVDLADRKPGWDACLKTLDRHEAEALCLIETFVNRLALTDAEHREQQERQRLTAIDQRGRTQPPTARQLAYLRALGDDGPPLRNMAEASHRIARLKRGKEGSPNG